MSTILRIRQKIIKKEYYLSSHAEDEMLDDRLERVDVENVEAEVCTECGERYFHAKILEEIDRLLEKTHDVKERIEVEVVSL